MAKAKKPMNPMYQPKAKQPKVGSKVSFLATYSGEWFLPDGTKKRALCCASKGDAHTFQATGVLKEIRDDTRWTGKKWVTVRMPDGLELHMDLDRISVVSNQN